MFPPFTTPSSHLSNSALKNSSQTFPNAILAARDEPRRLSTFPLDILCQAMQPLVEFSQDSLCPMLYTKLNSSTDLLYATKDAAQNLHWFYMSGFSFCTFEKQEGKIICPQTQTSIVAILPLITLTAKELHAFWPTNGEDGLPMLSVPLTITAELAEKSISNTTVFETVFKNILKFTHTSALFWLLARNKPVEGEADMTLSEIFSRIQSLENPLEYLKIILEQATRYLHYLNGLYTPTHIALLSDNQNQYSRNLLMSGLNVYVNLMHYGSAIPGLKTYLVSFGLLTILANSFVHHTDAEVALGVSMVLCDLAFNSDDAIKQAIIDAGMLEHISCLSQHGAELWTRINATNTMRILCTGSLPIKTQIVDVMLKHTNQLQSSEPQVAEYIFQASLLLAEARDTEIEKKVFLKYEELMMVIFVSVDALSLLGLLTLTDATIPLNNFVKKIMAIFNAIANGCIETKTMLLPTMLRLLSSPHSFFQEAEEILWSTFKNLIFDSDDAIKESMLNTPVFFERLTSLNQNFPTTKNITIRHHALQTLRTLAYGNDELKLRVADVILSLAADIASPDQLIAKETSLAFLNLVNTRHEMIREKILDANLIPHLVKHQQFYTLAHLTSGNHSNKLIASIQVLDHVDLKVLAKDACLKNENGAMSLLTNMSDAAYTEHSPIKLAILRENCLSLFVEHFISDIQRIDIALLLGNLACNCPAIKAHILSQSAIFDALIASYATHKSIAWTLGALAADNPTYQKRLIEIGCMDQLRGMLIDETLAEKHDKSFIQIMLDDLQRANTLVDMSLPPSAWRSATAGAMTPPDSSGPSPTA